MQAEKLLHDKLIRLSDFLVELPWNIVFKKQQFQTQVEPNFYLLSSCTIHALHRLTTAETIGGPD